MKRGQVLALLLAATLAATAVAAVRPAAAYTRLVAEDPGGITLHVQVPQAAVRFELDEDGYRTVAVDGIATSRAPGRPELPRIVVSVAVPLDAEVEMAVEAGPTRTIPGPPMRALPAADGAGSSPGPTVPVGSGRWPEELVAIEDAHIRGQRVARLTIHPLAYDPVAASVLLREELSIRVEFRGGRGFAEPGAAPLDRAVRRVLERAVLNRRSLVAAVHDWGAPKRERGVEVRPHSAAAATPAAKIRVDSEGLVRVLGSDLQAIGFDTQSVDPRRLEVSFRGQPVPSRVLGESDGVLEPGDAIEFFGTPQATRFASSRIYWLEEKPVDGLRFAQNDGTPSSGALYEVFQQTVRFEESNTVYSYGKPAAEGDPHYFWIWLEDNPNPPRVTSFDHVAELVDLAVGGSEASFRAFFTGRTDTSANPDHQVRLRVNGNLIGDSTWNGFDFHLAELPFDPALLVAGANTFGLEQIAISFPDIYYLDWYEIEYPRAARAVDGRLTLVADPGGVARYRVTELGGVDDAVVLDVTDPLQPSLLTGAVVSGSGPFGVELRAAPGRRYHVAGDAGRIAPAELVLDAPTNLRDPGNAADLIVVVPEGWESALDALVAHREAQGLRVVLAELTDVADEFAGGNVDDVAIRDFVQYAYEQWQGPPVSFLLLVGEANRDPQNYLGVAPFHFYMPTHSGVTVDLGETTTETWFGAIVGNDALPDVAVGRFSVRSAAEAAALVAKVIDYETASVAGDPWLERVVHIASSEAVFETSLETAAAHLPPHVAVDPQYRRDGASASSIRASLNTGAVASSFLGHGNVTFWADTSGPFFDNGDARALANAGRLPLVTALNCINGFIAHPTVTDSLAEVFHNEPSDGALATWTPSGLGFVGEYDALQDVLYRTIFVDHVPRVGAAITAALVETWLTRGVPIDLVKKMVLLGDPSGWLAVDADGDRLFDQAELDGGTDPGDRDSDDDGWLDGLEADAFVDADGDGRPNVQDADADDDALPDGLEAGVAVADEDTDVGRGWFRADADPLSVSDPLDPDSDGGGAPDGAEDLDADGAVGLGETDPLDPADDPTCAATPPPEIGAGPADALRLTKADGDVVLSWGDARAADPCLLYRIYAAPLVTGGLDASDFQRIAVTAAPNFTDRTSDPPPGRFYLIVAASPTAEGPWGHFP